MKPFVIAHFSDIHFCNIRDVHLNQLLNKRLYGYISYKIHRGKSLDNKILYILANELKDLSPNHIVVTGDLTHLSLIKDYEFISNWLNTLGSSYNITIIPGNHDFYIPKIGNLALKFWKPYMLSDGSKFDNTNRNEVSFPFLRIRDNIAIIGVNSSHPTPIFFADGHLGKDQLRALNNLLSTIDRYIFTILLIHHPPIKGIVATRKALKDMISFQHLSNINKVNLILHGHSHYWSHNSLNINGYSIPVLGVPSILSTKKERNKISRYNIYYIEQKDNCSILKIQTKSLSLETYKFDLTKEYTITIPL